MKARLQWIPCVLFSSLIGSSVYGVELGDTVEAVKAELGEASGSMQLGERSFLLYPRGMISFCDGLVSAVELEDEEAYTLRTQEETARQMVEEAQAEQVALERLAEGAALKDEILLSEGYQNASAAERINLWRKFRKKYPGVDVAEIYLAELDRYEREELLERKIAEQELRIARLEQKAAQVPQQPVTRVRFESPSRVYYPVPYIVRQPQHSNTGPHHVNPCPTPVQNNNPSVSISTTTPGLIIRKGGTTQVNGGYNYSSDRTTRSVSLVTSR